LLLQLETIHINQLHKRSVKFDNLTHEQYDKKSNLLTMMQIIIHVRDNQIL
jgi:hypothetical protein